MTGALVRYAAREDCVDPCPVIGYADFGGIQRMLYSFDLRMRTGDWNWDDEEVGMALQAGREWERNWDKR
jgi:hypothetical protein